GETPMRRRAHRSRATPVSVPRPMSACPHRRVPRSPQVVPRSVGYRAAVSGVTTSGPLPLGVSCAARGTTGSTVVPHHGKRDPTPQVDKEVPVPLPGPDTRVTELRVPGLGGTTGSSLLDTSDTVSVGGDTVGRLVRPADRLHRPTPGPMLRALSGSVPRTLEGYLWGRMTTGSAAQTAWVLLFPFTLANVAAWMLPPVDPTSTAARVFGS